MIGSRRVRVAVGVLGLVLVLPVLVAMVSHQAGTTDDGALSRDAQEYADDFGVSLDEATRRLSLQDEVGKLGASLTSGEADTFGGLWIQHTPTFKVKVAFTSNGTESLSRYEKGKALSEALEVVSVDTTYQALLDAQELAGTAVKLGTMCASMARRRGAPVATSWTRISNRACTSATLGSKSAMATTTTSSMRATVADLGLWAVSRTASRVPSMATMLCTWRSITLRTLGSP